MRLHYYEQLRPSVTHRYAEVREDGRFENEADWVFFVRTFDPMSFLRGHGRNPLTQRRERSGSCLTFKEHAAESGTFSDRPISDILTASIAHRGSVAGQRVDSRRRDTFQFEFSDTIARTSSSRCNAATRAGRLMRVGPWRRRSRWLWGSPSGMMMSCSRRSRCNRVGALAKILHTRLTERSRT